MNGKSFFRRHLLTILLLLVLAGEATALLLIFSSSLTSRISEKATDVTTALTDSLPDSSAAPDESENTATSFPSPSPQPNGTFSASDILAGTPVIAHAMGAVDGITSLNCLEAFEAMYSQGVRVFEADLRLTRDGQVILRHDWRRTWQENINEFSIPTLKEFLNTPILGQYTPLSFRDLLNLMAQYPDICIITDTEFTDADIVALQFGAMLHDAEELGLTDLFDRMFIQLYNTSMLQMVESICHFPHYIYTLYAVEFDCTPEAFEEIAAYCHANGIEGVTMWYYWWDTAYAPIAQKYGVSVYTHTVNDAASAAASIREGVSAVYTDTLTPGALS